MDLYTIIIMAHVIGTILGTGGATVAEIQINKALQDGRLDESERALMHANYWMIRVGLALIVVSAIAIFWYQWGQGSGWVLTSQKLWIKELMVVVIIVNAVALSYHRVPLWLGSAISFTSWWSATLLGLAGQLPYSFVTYLVGYVIAIFVIASILHLIRRWIIGR